MGINKVDYAGKTLIDLTEDTVKSESLLSGYTAHTADGEQIDGTLSLDEIKADIEYLKKFTPDSAKNNRTTSLWFINTSGQHNMDCMTPGVIATEDASTLFNAPISSGPFYATREVHTIQSQNESESPEHRKFIVKITEAYPVPGRVWTSVYNIDGQAWTKWTSYGGTNYPITTNAVYDLSAHPEYWNFPSNIICIQQNDHLFDFHISMHCTKFTANQGYEMFSTKNLKEMGGGTTISWDCFNTRVYLSNQHSLFDITAANGVHGMILQPYNNGNIALFGRRYNYNDYNYMGGWGSEVSSVYVQDGYYQIDMYGVTIT